MKATVIVDNIEKDGLRGEWGLSIYIETGKENILIDAGGSDLFLENARKLGIDVSDADYAVLSHAHYDHANGMEGFFKANKKAKFYIREAVSDNVYEKRFLYRHYIGIPKGILEKYSDRFIKVSGDYTIADGVMLIPHRASGRASIGKREHMYLKTPSGWKADSFDHEQSLVIDTPQGLVIFNSCSHGGADKIIQEISALFPKEKVLALIGGFHLYNKSEEYVRNLAREIKETGIKHIYTGHCTGEKAYKILQEELGDIVNQLCCGLVMEF
ncbi:MAG: MBL fold metallo-hydrolase [Anaerovoracaceae bacterium]